MPEDSEDTFMQRRLLLASVISALAIMLYVYVASRTAPKPAPDISAVAEQPAAAQNTPAPQAEKTATEKAATAKAPTAKSAVGQAAPEATAAARSEKLPGKSAEAEQEVVVETETYRVTFSNRGAVVKSWILKKYEDTKGAPLDLVHSGGAQKHGHPFQVALPGGQALQEVNDALFVIDDGNGPRTAPTTLTFEYAQGEWAARKTFQFEPQGYQLKVETELRRNGEPLPHLIAWPGGFGDTTQTNDTRYSQTFYYDPVKGKPVRNKAADAKKAPITNTGPYPFAGIDDLFFTAVFMPPNEQEVTLETHSIELVPQEGIPEQTFATMAVGGSGENDLDVFLGPKSIPLLGSISPRLREIVDFGWLGFLAVPLFYMLLWTHEHIVANYGWSIVVVTIFINFVLFPLKWKSTKSMKKMQALQPLVKQINEKYKGLGMRDPKKTQQNEEMMALYKKHGVNPMGGCLPMILQLPFFIAFYWVLTSAIEMRHAAWLWVPDLSRPETLAIRILPLAMIGTQFWQQSMTPQPSVDPAQTRMMKFMPLLFGFFFYGFQSGLVLYWLTSNLVGVAQQALLNRLPSEPVEIDQPRRRKRKQ